MERALLSNQAILGDGMVYTFGPVGPGILVECYKAGGNPDGVPYGVLLEALLESICVFHPSVSAESLENDLITAGTLPLAACAALEATRAMLPVSELPLQKDVRHVI